MNKQELMEAYTAEQLAEMVIKADIVLGMLKYSDSFLKSGFFDNPAVAAYELKLSIMQYENDKLKSEAEKYRKTFEDAKKEHDYQTCEYQKKIEQFKHDLKAAGKKIQDLVGENMKLQCERNDYKSKTELLEIEKMRVGQNEFFNFIPTEPIKVADMLINAEGEYEHSPIAKALCGTDKGTCHIFDIKELRQIAEYLLVYCNYNEEVGE